MGIIGVALAQNAQTAKKVILQFSCDPVMNVGDLVYIDPANNNKVLTNSNNTQTQQTIGVVIDKPSPQDCNVLILGIADGYTGLTPGGRIFLDSSGSVTQNIPTTGYVQHLGVAASASEILFIPSNERVKRT